MTAGLDPLRELARTCNELLGTYRDAVHRQSFGLPHDDPEEIWERWLQADKEYRAELTKRSKA